MGFKFRAPLLRVMVATAGLAGCVTIDEVQSWFEDSRGVALQRFKAKNAEYFPKFVETFFPSTRKFYRDYPQLVEARQDLKLIDVQRLSDDGSFSNEANLSWSEDSVFLGYEIVNFKNRQILVKSLLGDYSRRLAMMPKGSNDFLNGMVNPSVHSYNAGLRWSHDSTRFAFMSNGGTGEYNIYVGAVGVDERPIANSPTKDGYANWSPQTNEIVFVSARSGGGDLYLVELDGSRVRRLTTSDAVDIFPEWSPDGNRILFASGDASNHDLYVINRRPGGGWSRPDVITTWSQDDLRPRFSPDGQYIAFYATSPLPGGKVWNLHVVRYVPGQPLTASELMNTVVAQDVVIDLNTGPAWAPDSKKIFYVSRDPSLFNPIYGYNLFTGKRYLFETNTQMNRDIMMSNLGILSFRAQEGAWDRVFLALTNQGLQIQGADSPELSAGDIHYVSL